MPRSFWDQIRAGDQLELGSVAISQDDIVRFAAEFDAQPFHTDEEAARTTLLGGLSASGWHTCTLVMGLLEETIARRSGVLETVGLDQIIWLKPVRPGDVLAGRIRWLSEATCCCDSGAKIRGTAVEVCNERGDVVMQWQMTCRITQPMEPRRRTPLHCSMRRGRVARVLRRPGDYAIKYFEDVVPGDEIPLGDYAFTIDRIADFCAHYVRDRSCNHNVHAAAPVWHVTAAWMHCIVRYYEQQVMRLRRQDKPVPVLGPAVGVKHLRWHSPVDVGETITFCAWAERKIEISRGDWGLLVVGAEGKNSHGDTVVSFYPQMLLERRTGHTAANARKDGA